MNEQDLKQRLHAWDDFPLPDKQTMLAKVKTTLPQEPTRRVHRIRRPRLRPLLAACLTVALLVSALSIYAIAAEHAEYRAALAFFEQHELSADGLGRRDIRLVYRDIQSGDFRYDKTAEVIASTVGGYEITTDELTPEILQSLWDKKLAADERRAEDARDGFTVNGAISPTGISYVYRNQVRYAQKLEETCVVLDCYQDGTLAWSQTYPSVSVTDLAYTDTLVALAGRALLPNAEEVIEDQPALIMLDADGNVIHRTALSVNAAAIFADVDGVMLLNADSSSIEIARYDLEGNRTHHARKEFSAMGLEIVREFVDGDGKNAISIIHSNYSVKNALSLGDSYILHLQEWYSKDELLIRIDENAALLGEYRFYTDGEVYRFADIARCGDVLYLSGYAISEIGVDEYDELNALKARLLDGEIIDDTALTAEVQDSYTAVLLQCDLETGKTNAFYSVSGAVGDTFSLDADGNLIWRVSEIASVTHTVSVWENYEPNAVHIKGIGPVWEYTVSPEGILLGSRMTDDVAEFLR